MPPSPRGSGRRAALALALALGLAPACLGERASRRAQDLARLLERSTRGERDESARALHGGGAEGVDQPAESVEAGAAATQTSSDMPSELKAANIEVHEALMRAQRILAEQQRQQGDGSTTSGHGEGPAPAPERPTPQRLAEDSARRQEEVALQGGLKNLSKALHDPRGFLIELPGMRDFSAGTRAAIDLGPNSGRCLASGEFAGYGCGESKEFPRMCSCPGWLQRCHLPDDPQSIVDTFSKGDVRAPCIQHGQ